MDNESQSGAAGRSVDGSRVGRVLAPDGVEIVYDVAGSGDPGLVFVHGWAGNRHHWDLQVDGFVGSHRVVRMDLAGHGESGKERREWTMMSFAADVVAVVDASSLRRVVLIGHSLGGSVVVAAAQILGDRVAGVIGVDTWSALGSTARREDTESSIMLPDMRSDFRTGAAQFARLMCGPTTAADLVERITDEVTSMPPDIAVGVLEGVGHGYAGQLEAGLRSLDAPVSAISSETFRPKDDQAFASFGIAHVVIPGTGHYLMLQRPDDFNAELAAALTRSTE
jgi:pimeloyl-ACP methyl ester carboxylesterase